MSAKLIEISNALAEVTEAVAARTVAVHTEPRGSSSGVIWRCLLYTSDVYKRQPLRGSCEETTAISVLKNNEGAVSSRHEPRK